MNIAQQIKSFYTTQSESVVKYDHCGIYDECEEKAVDTQQDYDAESTTYEFADGSVLVSCCGEYSAYGCKA